MKDIANEFEKVAVVTRLAELNPCMGRTALMKYAYLLQTVRDVPLGYDFSLFSYGPYDSEVLATNTYAKHLGAVLEQPCGYPSGVKKELKKGPAADEIMKEATDFIAAYDKDINWVVENFRSHNAGEMELIGTMVFADREANAKNQVLEMDGLIEIVLAIKPHFTPEQASKIFTKLSELKLLVAVRTS